MLYCPTMGNGAILFVEINYIYAIVTWVCYKYVCYDFQFKWLTCNLATYRIWHIPACMGPIPYVFI